MHICFPFQKKLHLDFLYFSAFPTSNSLQILKLIPWKSLWDFTCLVSWGDKCFHCDELGHTGLFSSAQPNSLSATEAHYPVLPISLQKRQLATCFCILSTPAPLNDSCPLPASHSTCCIALWLKDQTHFDTHSRRPFLEIDVKGGERKLTSELLAFLARQMSDIGLRQNP